MYNVYINICINEQKKASDEKQATNIKILLEKKRWTIERKNEPFLARFYIPFQFRVCFYISLAIK